MSHPPPLAPAAKCPRCGQTIPAGAVLGACPHCLLAAGFRSEPAVPVDAPPPTIAELAPEFPELELLELLGRGGMGAVYKARQRDLNRVVALKLLRPGLGDEPTFSDRFAREARALAQLNHPGIVTLYEFGRTSGGLFFILMEFVDGVNLRQLLAAGRLAPREALAIVPPICDALQYAHDRGVVHRDIKPENILVDRLSRVKVADFGLAKLVGQAEVGTVDPGNTKAPASSAGAEFTTNFTETGKVMGTPRYMAPEQRERPREVDHRADIFALGVVLYQMLTGQLPDVKQLQPPSRHVQLDVRLDEIVLRALEKEPARRFQHASDMKTEVEKVTTSDASGEEKPTTSKRNSARRTVAAVVFLLAFVAALFTAQRFLPSEPTAKAAPPAAGTSVTSQAPTVQNGPMTDRIARDASPKAPEKVTSDLPMDDPQRAIIDLKLQQARRVLELTKARFDAGLVRDEELLIAQRDVAMLEAELIGDAVARARAKWGTAAELLRRTTARRAAGLGTDLDVLNATTEVAVAKLELDAVTLREGQALPPGKTPSDTGKTGTPDLTAAPKSGGALPAFPTVSSLVQPRLQFRAVVRANEPEAETLTSADRSEALALSRVVLLDEKAVDRLELKPGLPTGIYEVTLYFNPTGAARFAEITRSLAGQRLAILFDGRILLAPRINGAITAGVANITGRFSPGEAETFANALRVAIDAATTPRLSASPSALIKVQVLGSVNRPNSFELRDGSTLLEALGAAGGPTTVGDISKISIRHRDPTGQETLLVVNAKAIFAGKTESPTLRSGDVVYVPEVIF